jgi:sugar/nucleoside kinase (ribokinase family)
VNSISRISFDAFCFETVIQTFSESASALSALLECIETREVLYDFNLRGNMYGKRIFESSLKMATIARCNEEESRTISTILFGKMLKPAEFAQAISKTYYVPVVCVRLSDGGTIICQAGKAEHIRLPAGLKPGPGPLFNAELLGALLCGASPVEGAKSAMAGSSLHVSAAEPQG